MSAPENNCLKTFPIKKPNLEFASSGYRSNEQSFSTSFLNFQNKHFS